jgi:hypothetical protein
MRKTSFGFHPMDGGIMSGDYGRMNSMASFEDDPDWRDTGMTASQYHHMRVHGSDLLGVAASEAAPAPDSRMGTTPHGEAEGEDLAVSGESIAAQTKSNT